MSGFTPTLEHPKLETRTTSLISRRAFLSTAAGAAATLALYSNGFARHHLDITHRTFFLRRLPPAFDGFRIVQISDIHLEEYTEDFFLRHIIQHVNDLAPDLLLITGDFVSRGPLPIAVSYEAAARCAELLSTLTCPVRYGILGNHDAYVGSRLVRNHMEANGLPILVNQFVRIERGGQYLYLGGTDDISAGHPNLPLSIPTQPDAPVILMVHEPDYTNHILLHPYGRFVDLILSGHTHGGQVRIPGLRPLALPPLGKLYPEGHFQLGNLQLYVNRGVGTVGVPFRLNCPPEITLATLRPDNG